MFDIRPSFLFASLIWGSIGIGYFVYGKRQQSLAPMIGGILMVAVSYFCTTALVMSLLGIGCIVGIHVLLGLEE
jgi:hypothetical protein